MNWFLEKLKKSEINRRINSISTWFVVL